MADSNKYWGGGGEIESQLSTKHRHYARFLLNIHPASEGGREEGGGGRGEERRDNLPSASSSVMLVVRGGE